MAVTRWVSSVGLDGRATVKVAKCSSDRCVSRHSLCTKGGKDLGYSGAGDRVVFV